MELILEPRWKVIFPISQEQDALRPIGYLEDWVIDSYDNGCIHVQPLGGTIATCGTQSYHLGWSYYYPGGHDYGFEPGVNYFYNPGIGYFFYNFPNDRMYGSTTPPKPSDFVTDEIESVLVSENRWLFYYRRNRPSHLEGDFRVSNGVTRQIAYSVLDYLNSQDQVDPFLNQLYIDAASELKITSNSWANALEIIGLVKDLRDPVKLLKDLLENIPRGVDLAKDLWLKYRYLYSTTKADIEEIKSKAKILTDDGPQRLRASGSSNLSELHLRVDYEPYTGYIDPFSDLFIKMERYGFDPSLYNAWDMIPFSFVADWFLPIGDTLEELSSSIWAQTMPFSTTCLCSRKVSSVPFGSQTYKVYQRFGYEPSFTDFASNSKTSMHTWAKRGLDLVSLV